MEEMQMLAGIVDTVAEFPEITNFSKEEFMKKRVQWQNEVEGLLKGVDCRECKNKGQIYYLNENGEMIAKECECMVKRRTLQRIEDSGLKELLKSNTFESYQVSCQWQDVAKSMAWNYAKNPHGWLYFGGQSGAGKTHICTAVCNILIQKGYEVRYVVWRELLHELESNRFDNSRYSETMDVIKNIEVLYLDDFLKAKGDMSKMTSALEYAFEVINARYNSHKITIVSSEWTIQEIASLDEATAGRILQSAGNNIFTIGRGSEKNFRKKPV